jgi:hypothetical protein
VADMWGMVGCGSNFMGESMKDDNSLVFAYYKDGAANPTFLYFGDALKEVKCSWSLQFVRILLNTRCLHQSCFTMRKWLSLLQ